MSYERLNFELLYEPMPKQSLFHNSRAKFRLYAGGMGSGKTLAGVAEAIQLSFAYPGNYGIIGRNTYPELDDTAWKELLNFPVAVNNKEMTFIESPAIAYYNKQKHEIGLHDMRHRTNLISVISGRALEDAREKVGKGINLGWFYGDELTEDPEEVWDMITRTRLRRKVPCRKCGVIPKLRNLVCANCRILTIRHTAFGTTNPEGHDWVWKKFVASNDPDYFYVQATSDENVHLSEEYISGLGKMPEDWQKRYRWGSFETFEGLVYKEFQDKEPYVIPGFTIPEHWYRFVGIDHGYRNPTAILWGAVDTKGRVFIYDEFYASGKVVSEIATVLKLQAKENPPKVYLIDPATNQNRGHSSGVTIYSEFQDHGIYPILANNEVTAGINHVREMLKIQPDGKPSLQVFQKCVNLRMEMQTYRLKDIRAGTQVQNNPEKPLKKNDHCMDALRYMANYLWDTPELKQKKGFDYKEVLDRRRTTETSNWMAA